MWPPDSVKSFVTPWAFSRRAISRPPWTRVACSVSVLIGGSLRSQGEAATRDAPQRRPILHRLPLKNMKPWQRLAPDLAGDLGDTLQGVEDDVLRRLAADPVAAGALADPATIENLRVGLRGAIRQFLGEMGRPDAPADRTLFVLHGRLQRASGRGLEEMLAFYRHSSLAIWGRVAGAALARGLPAGVVAALADAVFAFGDELAAAASLGFDEARADDAVAADGRRRQLLRVLL